jgi:mannosyltransferase
MRLEQHQEREKKLRASPVSRYLSPEMSAKASAGGYQTTAGLLLAGIVVLAFALRFWRLGNWSFDSDEVFMLRDSLKLNFDNPRPLLYVLNHYLVGSFLPLDEFGLRLLPAIFGVLAIPTFYFVCRHLVGTRAALFGALLLTLSPLHVYYSQFARYWSLVFLLSAVYPYAIYIGLRERSRGALALGIVLSFVASLAHPASIILAGGLGLWLMATYLKRDQLARLWTQRRVQWGVGFGALLVAAIAVRFIPMLRAWVYHEGSPANGVFLLHLPSGRGIRQLSFLLSFVESLTLPLVLVAAAGIYLLWRGRERPLALLLTCLFVFQLAFITLISFRAPVSTFYLLPAVPVLFIGAGVFLDRLSRLQWELRPRWLLSGIVAVTIIAAGAPTLVSQYRDGRRWDLRGVGGWLEDRVVPGDIVFSDQPQAMAHYLPGTKVQRLMGDPAPLTKSMRILYDSGQGGALWIVAPAPSHAFRTNPGLGRLNKWLYANCQLTNTVGIGRVDFRQHYLQIYHCPPTLPN